MGVSVEENVPLRSQRRRRSAKRAITGGIGLVGAALLVATASPLISESSAGYSDGLYAQANGVSVPPTSPLASVVPSFALDTMQVLDVAGNLWIWGYYGNTGPGVSSAGQGGGTNGIDYTTGAAFNEHKPNQFKALENIKAMASSAYANYAIDEHGNLFGWGQNNGGLYMFGKGFGDPGRIVPAGTTPQNVTSNWSDAIMDTDVTSVASVEYGAAYTKSDGTIWTVGDNALSQRGQGTTGNGGAALRVATQVTKWPGGAQPNIVVVYSGYEGYYAVDDEDNVYFWGRSFRNGAGASNTNLNAAGCTTVSAVYSDFRCSTPILVPEITAFAKAEGVKSLGGGYAHGHLLTKQGNLYAWGSEENNSSGNDGLRDTSTNGTLPTLKAKNVMEATARFGSTQYITDDGTAWAYGNRLWGGAFSLNYGSRTPANSDHLTGKVWDPAQDSSKRKALMIGGNKDSASVVLDDGTILSWGENGGGAACGGYTYAACLDKSGNVASVVPGGTPNGLYVWAPAVIEGIQNVGRYQTISLNSNPFTGSAVMAGQTIRYQAVARNTFADPANYSVAVDISSFLSDVDVDPESIAVTVGNDEPVRGTLNGGKVQWSGSVPKRSQVKIEFAVAVKSGTPAGVTLRAEATMSVSGTGNSDRDAVSHITTTNPDELENCDTCSAP